MGHFAKLDEDGIVIDVIVVNNEVMDNKPFPASEPIGIAFCQSLFGADTRWAQTSYNSSFRYNFAGIGYFFDSAAGAFVAPKPYPSWLLNTETFTWDAPIPPPDKINRYLWDEATQSWQTYGPPLAINTDGLPPQVI